MLLVAISSVGFKGSVRETLKGVQAQCDKKELLIATNLTSICCVYKEKIVKNDSFIPKNVASIQIQKVAAFNSDRKQINLIPNK